ncbi:MAG TPA: hypothetical protein VGO39_07355 [Gaiellaceae bacterium]|jgi:hypothetical protein|nr:hypothetical protein [Gaiellaceae bacterium]
MARHDAAPLITLADRIPREGACAQARDIRALNRHTIALVNAHRIPPALQESLTSGVNALVAQTPPCLPPVTATVTPPVVTIVPDQGWTHDHGHGNGNGGDNGGGGGD